MKWHRHTCSWVGRLNIVKSFLPKQVCRFNSVAIRIPARYFEGIHKTILRFLLKGKRTNIATVIFKKKKQEESLPYLKTCYTATAIKSVLFWQKNKRLINETEQRTKDSRLIFDKCAEQFNGGRIILSTNGQCKNRIPQ